MGDDFSIACIAGGFVVERTGAREFREIPCGDSALPKMRSPTKPPATHLMAVPAFI